MVLSEAELREKLTRLSADRISVSACAHDKSAAVLVPFTRIHADWHLLFIRRAERHGDVHSGQVAFPGGATDNNDNNAMDTALREAEEEIGLLPQDVTLISEMQDYYSSSRYRVTPVVGVIPWPYAFNLQIQEVTRAFTIPLSWLATPENLQWRSWTGQTGQVREKIPYYRPYRSEQLWGLTAAITQTLVKALKYCS